jgi:hypothetical protein
LQDRARPDAPVSLSMVVCWTRMQAEAGQNLPDIIARKELERCAGAGLFFWGIGNPPNRSASTLARGGVEVDVVFSTMKGRARVADAKPETVLVWQRYMDAWGAERSVPEHVLVTSRGDTATGAKRVHYALVCKSEVPLDINDLGPFDPGAYCNLGDLGRAVGASQVTALVRRVRVGSSTGGYRINMRAKLAGSYWVKLTTPTPLSTARRHLLVSEIDPTNWRRFVTELRHERPRPRTEAHSQLSLL